MKPLLYRNNNPGRLLLPRIFMALLALLTTSTVNSQTGNDVVEIRVMEAVYDAYAEPPDPEADWQSVNLPLQDAVARKTPETMVRW